jgi:protein arginine kinase
MVNEEDHLRLQVFSSGLEIENLVGLIIEIDDKLSSLVDYAYSKDFGYLTACPTNVGTGLRISIMVHLPGLALTGNISKYFLASIQNFKLIFEKLDSISKSELRIIYEASDELNVVANEASIKMSDKYAKPIFDTNEAYNKLINNNK